MPRAPADRLFQVLPVVVETALKVLPHRSGNIVGNSRADEIRIYDAESLKLQATLSLECDAITYYKNKLTGKKRKMMHPGVVRFLAVAFDDTGKYLFAHMTFRYSEFERQLPFSRDEVEGIACWSVREQRLIFAHCFDFQGPWVFHPTANTSFYGNLPNDFIWPKPDAVLLRIASDGVLVMEDEPLDALDREGHMCDFQRSVRAGGKLLFRDCDYVVLQDEHSLEDSEHNRRLPQIRCIAVSPNGGYVAYVRGKLSGDDGIIHVYDTSVGEVTVTIDLLDSSGQLLFSQEHMLWASHCEVDPIHWTTEGVV